MYHIVTLDFVLLYFALAIDHADQVFCINGSSLKCKKLYEQENSGLKLKVNYKRKY